MKPKGINSTYDQFYICKLSNHSCTDDLIKLENIIPPCIYYTLDIIYSRVIAYYYSRRPIILAFISLDPY